MKDAIRFIRREGLISTTEEREINHLRSIRNELLHPRGNPQVVVEPETIDRLITFSKRLLDERTEG